MMDTKTENNKKYSDFIANIGRRTNTIKYQSPLVLPPKIIDNIANESNVKLGMRWLGNKSSTKIQVDFSYLETKTLLSIIVPHLIESVELCKPHDGFRKVDVKGYCVYLYQHEEIEFLNLSAPEERLPIIEKKDEQPRSQSPLVNNDSKPLSLDILDFANLINDKQIAIYTGAGISAGVVPTMSELEKSICLERSSMESYVGFVNDCLRNPEEKVNIMASFYNSCINGKATDAHKAITRICGLKGWSLLTENVDQLHQHSGIVPLGRDFLRSKLTREDFLSIDLILTVGLQTDENNFLARFKQYNPSGLIAAVNLNKPNYLANNDIFIQGDAQMLLPLLNTKLLEIDRELSTNRFANN